jgi:hypothetical protein
MLRSAITTLVASVALGMATSWAQGWLPDALRSFANSPSGWTICTALVVALLRPTPRWGAVLGLLSFPALVAGYTLASELRGLTYSPVLWGTIGVLTGPFIGWAAATLRGRGVATAVGTGLLAGVLVSDGIYGLTRVADTTSPVYWTLCLVGAVVLLVGMGSRVPVGLMLAATLAATGVALLANHVVL